MIDQDENPNLYSLSKGEISEVATTMSGRGRDRFRRDYPPRSEEKAYHGRNSVPPSRHLWVGSLSLDINERVLANLFSQFGEIENIAFQPGRSYAFVNFRYDEEAFAAVSALQGFDIGGHRLKIEFAKADKSSSSSRNEDSFQRRDEHRSELRGSNLMPSRIHNPSPDYPNKRKMSDNDKDAEPSEVLWIGFPAQLRVDEEILKKAFSPFGEIERITAFQGRSYAFVRYKDIKAACRAKETLHGRLFGNPRVHICFAKNESGSSNIGKNSSNISPSPRFDPYGRSGFSEEFRHDRNRKGLLGDVGFDQRFHTERETGPRFHNFPQKGQAEEDDWDLPEDNLLFHGNKKMKSTSFPADNELPEFSLPGFDRRKQIIPRESSDYNPHGKINESFAMSKASPYQERGENWGGSYDRFEAGPDSGSLPMNRVERKKLTPEPHLWKWEGTIAKGGTPVCRARCFPKGKVLDMPLPELIDCTARTGLDMLAKHYYQAASTWVVFFSPESDADIGYYNEFMHYLEEKQRAAVAKLDDRTTLFLVPPSEFSEKVLKVPGNLSISGVILRLENSTPNMAPPQNPHLNEEPRFLPHQGERSSPPGLYPPISTYSKMVNSGISDYMVNQRENTLGYNLNFGNKNGASQISNSGFDPSVQGYNPNMPRVLEETRSLQPEHLTQLASSLLGHPRESSSLSKGEDFRQLNAMSNSGTSYQQPPQRQYFENNFNQANSEFSASQFGQGNLQNRPLETSQRSQEEEQEDPQKKLQATLQLAATLLQQIQQAKGT